MYYWFFNICYVILLLIFSPVLLYARIFHGKYREGFAQKFLGAAPKLLPSSVSAPDSLSDSVQNHSPNSDQNSDQNSALNSDFSEKKRVWIHAVSVGEVNLAAVILKAFRRHYPGYEFVISTTSRTGMELARKKFTEDTVFYAPLDFSWAVRRALQNLRPDVLVLVELEIWPNLLSAARRAGIPVVVVNGRLGEKSFRHYSLIRSLISRVMRNLTLVVAQDAASARHFESLGVPSERVFNVGSIKYDGAQPDRGNEKTRRLSELWNVLPSDRIFLAGSTQDPEEAMAVEVFRRLAPAHPELRLILVPRHPERFEEVWKMISSTEFSAVRRTQIPENEVQPHREQILLVDTIGELGGWWGTSFVGFVGGSMGARGGQNMLEPAAYGTAVSFGPNTWNFRDIVSALLSHEAAVVVRDTEELASFVSRCLEEPEYAAHIGKNAASLVASQQGALEKTMQLFSEKINS